MVLEVEEVVMTMMATTGAPRGFMSRSHTRNVGACVLRAESMPSLNSIQRRGSLSVGFASYKRDNACNQLLLKPQLVVMVVRRSFLMRGRTPFHPPLHFFPVAEPMHSIYPTKRMGLYGRQGKWASKQHQEALVVHLALRLW